MRGIAAGRTFPAHRPTRQIDHVLVRGPLRAAKPAEAVRLPLSDHRALVVDCAPH
jgi:endonuclease/exonuclease/phosphatase (EEP) superfamily protein YafD